MATQPNLFDAEPDAARKEKVPGTMSRRPDPPDQAARDFAERPPDQAARDFAIDPRHHVVLEASAGTGKTRVLVDRYVKLIEKGVDPEHILAITFTRKAAAEMRERVFAELRRQAALNPAMQKRVRALDTHLTDVNILTIDAFCFGLLREFPLEADVDPAFEIADETEMARYVNEAIALTLRACRGLVATDEHVRLLLAKVRLPQLRGALEALLDRRHVALPALATFVERHPHTATTEAICRTFVERVDRVLAPGPDLTALIDDGPAGSAAFRWLRDDLLRLPELAGAATADVRRFRSRLEPYFLTDKGARKQSALAFKDAFDSPAAKKRHNAAIKTFAPQIEGVLDALDRDVNALVARGLLRLLTIAIQRYEGLLRDHAVLDFVAMLERAVRLLKRQEDFARSRLKLQSRYHHVLVDELQDTSRLQWDLIESLVRAWQEGEGPEETTPSIFVVGDRKQSIYRFRQAEVTLLDEATRFIGGLRPGAGVRTAITTSFRAVPELLAFINALGDEIQSDRSIPERFSYAESDRFPTPSVGPRALRDGEPVLGVAAGGTVAECAAAVAAEIDRLLGTAATPGINVRTQDGARPIQPEDIAILFRARTGHQFFEAALESRGIRTYVYKGLGFFDAPEVQDLQALIRYLAEPESDLRAAEFLRSRFVRLSDDGLVKLAPGLAAAVRSPAFDVAAAGLDEIDAPLLERLRASASRWLELADRVPPAELLDRVINESAYVWELRGRRLKQARENIKKVRTLVRRVQNRGYTTLRRLADYFETLRAGDESNAMIEAVGAVNLMTIHAAKGLEFPVVFIVNMHQPAGGGSGIHVIADGPGGESDVIIGGGASPGTTLEAERDDEELRRLLYVATTRARDRLYLSAVVKDGKLESRKASLGALLPQALRGVLLRAAAAGSAGGPAAGPGDGAPPVLDWTSASGQAFAFRVCGQTSVGGEIAGGGSPAEDAPPVPVDASPPVPVDASPPASVDAAPLVAIDPLRVAVTSVGVPHDAPATGPQARTVRTRASDRLAGTLVHRLFQRRVTATVLDDLTAMARQLIKPEEWVEAGEAGDVDDVAALAASTFAGMRARPDVMALLDSSECHYEVPFSCRLSGALGSAGVTILRGSVDCLAFTADGRIVIIEFKTGEPRPDHAVQVAVYQEAMRAAWPGRVVDTLLVYPPEIT